MSSPSVLPYRLLALVAGFAHIVDRVVRWPLRQLRLGFLPGGLIAAGVVLLLAVTTATATLAAYGERPQARTSSLSEITQGRISSGLWVAFDGLLINEPREASVSIFSNGALVGQVERIYYLVRNPENPAEAFLVRSALDPAEAVLRTLTARVTDDPAAVGAAIEALGDGAAGVTVDESVVLDESAGSGAAEPMTGDDGAPLAPSDLASLEAGADVRVSGRIVGQAPTADGASVYLLADQGGSSAVVLRSPHPPDAIPVRLDGTIVSDPFNIGNLLEEWRPQEQYGELAISNQRLLALRVRPAFEEPSWWGVILLALIGALLIGGTLLGYPVFRPRSGADEARAPARGEAASIGGEHAVRIVGTLPTPHGPTRLDGEQGKLEWLPVAEVARTRWRYWGAQLGDLRGEVEAAVRAASQDAEQLVLHSPVGSVLWPLPAAHRGGAGQLAGGHGDSLRADPGDLFFVRGSAAGIRLRAPDANAFLVFGDASERDRALREIVLQR